MRLTSHQLDLTTNFMGLWDRGSKGDVPKGHSIACHNVMFDTGVVKSRSGLIEFFDPTYRITRMFLRRSPSNSHIYLDDAGGLKIDGDDANIVQINGMTDFSALNLFSRTFITPHDGRRGLENEKVKIEKGGVVRNAAGPALTARSAISISSGQDTGTVLDVGTHKFAVVGETDTGHLVPPGPKIGGTFTPVSYNAPGDKRIDISNIPTGPSYIVKRHLIATKSGLDKYYFVPGGTINNNTTKNLSQLGFFDTSLIESADYLFDVLEEIPAGVGIAKFAGRVFVWGFHGEDESLIRVSKIGEPEHFSKVDGFIVVEKDNGGLIQSCVPLREVLYVFKDKGTYYTENNGQSPGSWYVGTLDLGVGTSVRGVSAYEDKHLVSNDHLLIADRSGILLFDGVIRRPELTWKIEKWWKRINFSKDYQMQLLDDPEDKRLYVILAYKDSDYPDYILYGDYSEGLSAESIKWATWKIAESPDSQIRCAILSKIGNDVKPTLKVVRNSGSVSNVILCSLSDSSRNDLNDPIDSYYYTNVIGPRDGSVSFFNGIRLTAEAKGEFLLTVKNEDESRINKIREVLFSSYVESDRLRLFNFVSERASIGFRMNEVDKYFKVSNLVVFHKVMWATRPGS